MGDNEGRPSWRTSRVITRVRTAAADPHPADHPPAQHRSKLIGCAVAAGCLLVGALILFRDGPAAGQADISLPANVALAAVSPPSGFRSTELPNGWTLYSSETEGFSIALPPTWRPDARDDVGPALKFYATDLVPTYPPITGGGSPTLFLTRQTAHEGEVASSYWESVRRQVSQYPQLVGEVAMTKTSLRDGLAYVLTSTFEVSGGEKSETVYGLLHGPTEYRLVFALPEPYFDEYEELFHDIALTFDVAA